MGVYSYSASNVAECRVIIGLVVEVTLQMRAVVEPVIVMGAITR